MPQATSDLAMKVGVPSAENTAPRKVEATSRIITMLAVCAVRKTESLNTAQVSLPWAAVTSSAPTQPSAAPSVGVAQPVTIEPSVARISAAGGIRPRKNSRKMSRSGTSSSFVGQRRSELGFSHTRTIV